MNLLPIVIALLLLMSALAYSQVVSVLQRTAVRMEYACFIQKTLRLEQNEMQEEAYDKHHGDGGEGESRDQAIGRAKINIGFFATEPSNLSLFDPYRNVLHRLIQNLYGHRAFFQKALADRPDVGESVLRAVLETIREKRGEGNFSLKNGSSDRLSKIPLEDPFLNALWQDMVRKVLVPGACQGEVAKTVENEPNILDFLEFSGEKNNPYRIWRAEEPLLEAVFLQPEVVVEVIAKRNKYFKELDKVDKDHRGEEKSRIKALLEDEFGKRAASDLPSTALDFTPTLSKPPQRRR